MCPGLDAGVCPVSVCWNARMECVGLECVPGTCWTVSAGVRPRSVCWNECLECVGLDCAPETCWTHPWTSAGLECVPGMCWARLGTSEDTCPGM
eukprot:7000573-Pyramimonas_sp.AAC.1